MFHILRWLALSGMLQIDGIENNVKFVVTGSYDNRVTADGINNW